jgi:hypothetical protein
MKIINMINKKKPILLLFFVTIMTSSIHSQGGDFEKDILLLQTKIKSLEVENSKLKNRIVVGEKKLLISKSSIDSIRAQTFSNSNAISQTANQLGIQITTTEQTAKKRIDEVGQSLSTNSLYGIIGVLLAILLSGILYWLLSKRQQTDKNQLSNIINSTISELTQESAKLDVQLLDVIEKQLRFADKLNETEQTIDHTFHKNSANELQRIANYANTLAPESQEAIALQGSLGRLKNYFNASDYEITDFTGKEYDERIPMRIRETIFDDEIALGKEIVIKTWEPQIKFKNEIIQKAKIDTKYNK